MKIRQLSGFQRMLPTPCPCFLLLLSSLRVKTDDRQIVPIGFCALFLESEKH